MSETGEPASETGAPQRTHDPWSREGRGKGGREKGVTFTGTVGSAGPAHGASPCSGATGPMGER